jgi:hypothetical protein
MAKITLDDITSSYASTSLFQANFTAIETEFNDKVLYRVNPVGEANQMENDLDMNSNSILNASTINTDVIILNGLPITAGGNATTLTYVSTEFTNVAGDTIFNCDYTVGFLEVFYNGVLLSASDFTALDGTSFTLVDPVAANTDLITCKVYSSFLEADMLQKSLNLSDLSDIPTARTSLGLGTAALVDTGTAADQVPTNADVRNPRNRIVNPSMAISQENGFGTSVVPANTNFYIADEVDTRLTSGSGAVLQTSYQTLDGKRSTRMTVTTAATDLTGIEQVGRYRIRLEKSNIHQLDNGDVVLAFKCRTNWSGKIPVALQNGDGTRTYVSDFDVVAGINQVFKVIPFEASTVGAEPNENGKALQVDLGYNNEDTYQQPAANNDAWQTGNFFCSDESTQWTKTINNYVEITNVDLYAGNVPREFQPNSYAQDLAECQRYYIRYDNEFSMVGIGYTTNIGYSTLDFPVELRTAPVLLFSNLSDFQYFQNGAVNTGATSVVGGTSTKLVGRLDHIGTITATAPLLIIMAANGWLAFNARL